MRFYLVLDMIESLGLTLTLDLSPLVEWKMMSYISLEWSLIIPRMTTFATPFLRRLSSCECRFDLQVGTVVS